MQRGSGVYRNMQYKIQTKLGGSAGQKSACHAGPGFDQVGKSLKEKPPISILAWKFKDLE